MQDDRSAEADEADVDDDGMTSEEESGDSMVIDEYGSDGNVQGIQKQEAGGEVDDDLMDDGKSAKASGEVDDDLMNDDRSAEADVYGEASDDDVQGMENQEAVSRKSEG